MIANSVLIVDDDVKLLQLLKAYFDKEGFITYTAGDGLEALQAVQMKNPDIMILDLMLPGLDGLEIARRLRASTDPVLAGIYIIMLTARGSEYDKVVGFDLGLASRDELSRLMRVNFPSLAAANTGDMKWKKFLYRQFCAAEGIYVCPAPSCGVCKDYAKCFGPEQ